MEGGVSSVERILLEKDNQDEAADLMDKLQTQALLCAKTGNLQGLEEVIYIRFYKTLYMCICASVPLHLTRTANQ